MTFFSTPSANRSAGPAARALALAAPLLALLFATFESAIVTAADRIAGAAATTEPGPDLVTGSVPERPGSCVLAAARAACAPTDRATSPNLPDA